MKESPVVDPEAQQPEKIPVWFKLQVRARKIFNRVPLLENQKIFLLTLLIGIVCGLAAVAYHLLLDFFQNHLIYRAATIAHWWKIPLILLLPMIGGLVAGAGMYFFAPEASGSGIPQVKKSYYLDGGKMKSRVIWAKGLLSSLNIGTGASLGREGPTVQICAAIASWLGRVFVLSRRGLQSLMPVGAAAGLAAAFNTPIAAVTFTLEEILGNSTAKPLGSIVIAAVIAAVIERSILGEHPLFNVPHYLVHGHRELIFYAILGILAGPVSALFSKGLLRLRAFFKHQKALPIWTSPAVGGLLVGVVGLIGLLSTGSSSIFGVGYSELSIALQGSLPLKILVILGTLKLIATVTSYGSGSSGGIFGPSLYIGGMLGGAVGLMARTMLQDPSIQPGAFALVGMGATFAGIVRAPVTSIIMIFEMTNNYSLILPLMISNIISYALAKKLDPVAIYDALLLQDGIHLPESEHPLLRHLKVRQAMTKDVVTLNSETPVEEAFRDVQALVTHHHAYPVVNSSGSLVGVCTFNDLKRSLANGHAKEPLNHLLGKQSIVCAHLNESLDVVAIRLGKQGFSQLPVVSEDDPKHLIGIITMHDIARALADEHELLESGTIRNQETALNS